MGVICYKQSAWKTCKTRTLSAQKGIKSVTPSFYCTIRLVQYVLTGIKKWGVGGSVGNLLEWPVWVLGKPVQQGLIRHRFPARILNKMEKSGSFASTSLIRIQIYLVRTTLCVMKALLRISPQRKNIQIFKTWKFSLHSLICRALDEVPDQQNCTKE